MRRAVEERLWDKVERAPEGCWRWTGCVDRYGYGLIADGRKLRNARRVVYEVLVGVIGPRLSLIATCEDRRCVRPEHMVLKNKGCWKPTTGGSR